MTVKDDAVRDTRGLPIMVGDLVVCERSFYGMRAGEVVEVRKHIKVQIDEARADWFDPKHVVKVMGFEPSPFRPEDKEARLYDLYLPGVRNDGE